MRSTPQTILKFYQSTQWKKVRKLKRQIARGICEECGNAGWEVHHKIPLTLLNLHNAHISMGLDNLELLCTSCHNAKRSEENEIRRDIAIDEHGNVYQKQEYKAPPGVSIEIVGTDYNGSRLHKNIFPIFKIIERDRNEAQLTSKVPKLS